MCQKDHPGNSQDVNAETDCIANTGESPPVSRLNETEIRNDCSQSRGKQRRADAGVQAGRCHGDYKEQIGTLIT